MADPHTGLANQLLLLDRLMQALTRRRRHGGEVVVCHVDLDNLAEINLNLGYTTGNDVLCETSRRLVSILRSEDTVGRVGSSELVVVLTVERRAGGWAAHAPDTHTLDEPVVVGGSDIRVHSSLGVAIAEDTESAEDVLARAERSTSRRQALTAPPHGTDREPGIGRCPDEPAAYGSCPSVGRAGAWCGIGSIGSSQNRSIGSTRLAQFQQNYQCHVDVQRIARGPLLRSGAPAPALVERRARRRAPAAPAPAQRQRSRRGSHHGRGPGPRARSRPHAAASVHGVGHRERPGLVRQPPRRARAPGGPPAYRGVDFRTLDDHRRVKVA